MVPAETVKALIVTESVVHKDSIMYAKHTYICIF